MNKSQSYIYGIIEKQISDALKEYRDKIATVQLIKFFPKKDGKEKANFALNFGFDNYGESYIIHWRSGHDEKRRYVTINLDSYYEDKARHLVFSTAPVWENRNDPDDRLMIVQPTNHSIWLDTDRYRKYYDKDMQGATKIFELIKNEYLHELEETVNEYEEQLKRLPNDFETLCNAATEFNKVRNMLTGTIGSYAYRLQGTDFHYFINQED